MANKGTSIRIFLADGSPEGLWVVEKSNWTGVALMAPRSRYSALQERPEMTGSGIYVLVGPADAVNMTAKVYIGESDELRARLGNHHKNKDFWTRVVVFTSKDSNLNKAHVRYLESRLIAIAAESARAEIDNGTAAPPKVLSEAERADMEAFLADMLLIYPVLGVTAFERTSPLNSEDRGVALYLTGKDTKATGRETTDGLVVYEGALGRIEVTPSMTPSGRALRDALIAAGTLVAVDGHLRLTHDYVFNSPSAAADALLGRSANGRTEWKDADGTTLKTLQERDVKG